jgi:hypothetical protein
MTGETLGFTAPLVYNPAISCHLAVAVPDVFSRVAEPVAGMIRHIAYLRVCLDWVVVTRQRRVISPEKGIVEEGP